MSAFDPKLTLWVKSRATDATIMAAERSMAVEAAMQKHRRLETPDDRNQRLIQEARLKKDQAAENEAAVDQMIRQNVKQYGP